MNMKNLKERLMNSIKKNILRCLIKIMNKFFSFSINFRLLNTALPLVSIKNFHD